MQLSFQAVHSLPCLHSHAGAHKQILMYIPSMSDILFPAQMLPVIENKATDND